MSTWQARRLVSAVVVVTLILAVAGVAAADRGPRRFVALLQGNAHPVMTPDPCILNNTETLTGHAFHFGNFSMTTEEVVDLCSNPEGAEVTGQFVITLADGDQISAVYRTLAQLDFTAGQITAIGRYEITGGSGRFEHAKGDGVISALGSLVPPDFGVIGGLFGDLSLRRRDSH